MHRVTVVNRFFLLPAIPRKLDAIVSTNVTSVTAFRIERAHPRGMKFDSQSNAAARPDWTYSVQKPAIFSAVWVLYLLSKLSIPIAIAGVLFAAKCLGWVEFN
jgi:hypothetical protein